MLGNAETVHKSFINFIALVSSFSGQSQASARVTRCVTNSDCGNQYLECFHGYINGQLEQIGYCQNPWDFSRSCSTDYECLQGLSCQPLDPTKCSVRDPDTVPNQFPRNQQYIDFPNDFGGAHMKKAPCVKFCKVKHKVLGKKPPRPPWKCDRTMDQSGQRQPRGVSPRPPWKCDRSIPKAIENAPHDGLKRQQAAGSGQLCQRDTDCQNPFLNCIRGISNGEQMGWGTCQTPWDFNKSCKTNSDCYRGFTCGTMYCREPEKRSGSMEDYDPEWIRVIKKCKFNIVNGRSSNNELQGLQRSTLLDYYANFCVITPSTGDI